MLYQAEGVQKATQALHRELTIGHQVGRQDHHHPIVADLQALVQEVPIHQVHHHPALLTLHQVLHQVPEGADLRLAEC